MASPVNFFLDAPCPVLSRDAVCTSEVIGLPWRAGTMGPDTHDGWGLFAKI